MSDEKTVAKVAHPKVPMRIGNKGLRPRTIDELYRLSVAMSKSGMMPKGMDTPEKIFVAVQMGLEVGLSPMQAVQNIAVINGKPTVWGDAALGLVQASGLCEWFKEEPILDEKTGEVVGFQCSAKRRDNPEAIIRQFAMGDAERARLLGKPGPWQDYRPRMYQMRARSFCLRDGFADVLKGLNIREEVEDYAEAVVVVQQSREERIDNRLAEAARHAEAPPPVTIETSQEEETTATVNPTMQPSGNAPITDEEIPQ